MTKMPKAPKLKRSAPDWKAPNGVVQDTKELRNFVEKAYSLGFTYNEMGQELGLTYNIIGYLIQRYKYVCLRKEVPIPKITIGTTKRGRGPIITPEILEFLRLRAVYNHQLTATAKILGITSRELKQIMLDNNITLPKRSLQVISLRKGKDIGAIEKPKKEAKPFDPSKLDIKPSSGTAPKSAISFIKPKLKKQDDSLSADMLAVSRSATLNLGRGI